MTSLALLGGFVGTAQAKPIAFQGYPWNVFDGTGNLGQHWSASHVQVVNGVLSETVSGGVSGGVGMQLYRTFGTYHVRYRMSRGAGKYAILLFGHEKHNEIDFAESPRGESDRTTLTATLHYGSANHMIHLKTHGDFSVWHTAGVIWQPGKLTFTLDGKVWGVINQHVPSTPMHETIQTAAFGAGTASRLEVSDVHILN